MEGEIWAENSAEAKSGRHKMAQRDRGTPSGGRPQGWAGKQREQPGLKLGRRLKGRS